MPVAWKRWTAEEDRLLRQLLTEEGCSCVEAAEELGRTKDSVWARAKAMKVSIGHNSKVNHAKRARIMGMIVRGASVRSIAKTLGVTDTAIRYMLNRMASDGIVRKVVAVREEVRIRRKVMYLPSESWINVDPDERQLKVKGATR